MLPAPRRAEPRGQTASVGPTLLDRLIPEFDFGHRYAIVVPAPRATVAEAAESYRPDSSPLLRFLFRLRGLGRAPGTLRRAMGGARFTVLAEEPGEEVVLGVAGRFWALDELSNLESVPDARAFAAFDRPGRAKAAVNLRFEGLSASTTRVSTETRVKCVDAAAYWRFAPYWAVIRLFSGWLRRDMLLGIRRLALHQGRE